MGRPHILTNLFNKQGACLKPKNFLPLGVDSLTEDLDGIGGETNLLKKRISLKGKNLVPLEANSFV